MARGSGLFIDSSTSSDLIKFCTNINPQQQQHKAVIINSFPNPNMDTDSDAPELSTIQFQVVNYHENNNENDDHDHNEAPGPSEHRRPTVMDEMDFFAINANENNKEDEQYRSSTAANLEEENDRVVVNVNTGLHLLTANMGSDESAVNDGISTISEEKKSPKSAQLSVLQVEVDRINQENQQLKNMLKEVNNSYNALQRHLVTLMQQQHHEHDNRAENNNDDNDSKAKHNIRLRGERESVLPKQFMKLRLAESISNSSEGPSVLCRSRSPPTDNRDTEEVPKKIPRLNGSTSVDQAAEATIRKARVSVRARSESPMISDGCQWRKYGQKMAKGNPCPRAYYRCTMGGTACPVRKQVQRCAEDRSILTTTYEGTHNHPLPSTAMMMASATSSAARMLLSGSMPSSDTTSLINNPNFLAYSRSLFPGSPPNVATLSASAPFPTITLDLTHSPNTASDGNPLHQLFQRTLQPNHFPVPFAGPSALPIQLFGQPLYNQSRFSGLQISSQDDGTHNNNNSPLADTVTALTTDPNFTAALAAVITSLISNGGAPSSINQHVPAVTSESNGNNTNSHDNSNSKNN